QSLGRIALRDKRDLAEPAVRSIIVAFGLENFQILVVQPAAGGGLALVGGLDHRDVRQRGARHPDQRANPPDRLPHGLLPSTATIVRHAESAAVRSCYFNG